MNLDAYHIEYKILSSDVDLNRRLRLSRLFTLLQEAAIAHTEALGFGRDKTLDRGWLWVVALQQLRIQRLPRYDERIVLDSVPGETMHTLFPRYYRISDASGAELLTASSIWTLMNARTRTMASPQETGVLIHGMAADWDCFFPRPPKAAVDEAPVSWTVPYSVTDLNGHMNNARYLDLAVDAMPPRLRELPLRGLQAEYAAELRLGDRMELRAQEQEKGFLFSGFTDKRIFRLGFEFAPGRE
ncbi:MAG: hypothetical protein IKQ04_02940 [Oscillospiraceae bacterium]|nr:hypothetical protein [Oscillospiraceae bacterium]